jgi:hypothetical protein
MTAKLPHPSLTKATVSLAAGVPVDSSEEPLDPLTQERVQGLAVLTGGRVTSATTGTALGVMPMTQGEAAEFIESQLKAAFGKSLNEGEISYVSTD